MEVESLIMYEENFAPGIRKDKLGLIPELGQVVATRPAHARFGGCQDADWPYRLRWRQILGRIFRVGSEATVYRAYT